MKIYRSPGGIASDEPYTYAQVYALAEATFSDRVHACVATLAYGGRAHLFNPATQRSALFDRVGATDVESGLVSIDQGLLEAEEDATLTFLGSVLA